MPSSIGQRLFEPFGIERFLREHWLLHKPFVLHASPDRLPEVSTLRQLSSGRAVLEAEFRQLKGWLTQGAKFTAVRHLSRSQAEKLWGTKIFTLVADHVDDEIPVIRGLLESIRDELGYTLDCDVHANVYCSPPGVGSRAHFDKTEVIIYQVRGRKEWKYAANTQLPFPVDSYFGHIGDLLAKHLETSLPDVMPQDSASVTLEPGSVLFVPRGVWHETKASDDESVSITLTMVTKTWLTLLSELITDAVIRRPEFRVPVPPNVSDETHRELVATLANNIEKAAAAVRALSPAELASRHFGLKATQSLRVASDLQLRQQPHGLELWTDAGGAVPVQPAVERLAHCLLGTERMTVADAVGVTPDACFAHARLVCELLRRGLLQLE